MLRMKRMSQIRPAVWCMGRIQVLVEVAVPLGPLDYIFSQHSPTTRPSVERTAEKAFMLSDRVWLSSAEARVEKIKGRFVGVKGPLSPLASSSSPHTRTPEIVL